LKIPYKTPLFITLSILIMNFLPPNYQTFLKGYAGQVQCNAEAFELLAKIKKIQSSSEDKILLHEPLFPFDGNKNLDKSGWGLTFQNIEETNAALVGIKAGFGKQFLKGPPEHFLAREDLILGW